MVKKKTKATRKKKEKDGLNKVIYWAPRVLMIIFIGMISAFALDAFTEYSGISAILAFFIHMVPSIILIIFLMIAWIREKIGFYIFAGLGIIFGVFFNAFTGAGFFFLVLPIWMIAILFLLSNKLNN